MKKILLLLCVVSTNVYAYCSIFTSICKVQYGDEEMYSAIKNTIMMTRGKYISRYSNKYRNTSNLSMEEILNLNDCNNELNCKPQETIDEYTNRLLNAFIESGIIENDRTQSRFDLLELSINSPALCPTPMKINLYTGRDYNVLPCLDEIIRARMSFYDNYVSKEKQQKVDMENKIINDCDNKYYNSREYKKWAEKKKSFINKRNKICINNGYSTLDCYNFSLKDQIGYDIQYPPPKNTCNDQ